MLGAAVFELASFGGYILLLWLVGRRASARLGLRETTQITLGGAAATRLLPTAGAGGAALTLWALRRSGLSTRGATRTLLTFLVLLYSVFLGSIAVTGTLLARRGRAAGADRAPGRARHARHGCCRWPPPCCGRPARAASAPAPPSWRGGARRDRRTCARSIARLLGAFAWWGFDMAVLWAMLHAFGTRRRSQVVVLAYFLGQVGNTIPIPGAVSGGLVGALLAFGVDADLAIVSVLAYRAIAIWVPAPIGLVALSALRRTIAAWGREDVEAPAEVEPAQPVRSLVPRDGPPGVAPARGQRHAQRHDPPASGTADRARRGRGGAVRLTASGVIELPDLEQALTDLSDTLGTWTYALVGGLAFLETGAFVGLVAPGETAVVLGGVVAAEGGVDLVPMLLIVWLAAAAGDLASFMLGRRLGRRFLVARGPRLGVTAPRLARVDSFFDRHGAKAILVGRFVGIIRAVAPFLAGSSGMRLRAFLPWSLLGTAAWAATFTLVGYAFHESFSSAADLVAHADARRRRSSRARCSRSVRTACNDPLHDDGGRGAGRAARLDAVADRRRSSCPLLGAAAVVALVEGVDLDTWEAWQAAAADRRAFVVPAAAKRVGGAAVRCGRGARVGVRLRGHPARAGVRRRLPRARPRAGLSSAAPGAHERVDLLLLAHDHVLEPVLEGLRVTRVAGGRDRVLERLDRLAARARSAARRSRAVGGQPEPVDRSAGVPPRVTIFSVRRRASARSAWAKRHSSSVRPR